MIAPAIPLNDDARVAALHRLGILDTPEEERFERLTQIAMTALQTPMASVSLIDRDRQWCKSSPGMGKQDVHRSISFCGHTILQKTPLIINDTHLDERFHDNPVVTNEPRVRAYIGIPLFSVDGHCIGSLCVVDVREREFTEDQIKIMEHLAVMVQNEITNFVVSESLHEALSARRAAEKADQAKGQFLAVMSHEIRTPLNGIIGITDLLRATKLNHTQDEYVQIIYTSGNTLLALINDILDFSKIEAGKLELEMTPMEIRRFLGETLAMHLHNAKAKNLELHHEVDPAVPVAVLGDLFRLRQILLNLVGNALKFTRQGEIRMKVALESLDSPTPFLVFSVRDTGPGMTPDGVSRLFQPFSQADNSVSRNYGGTGLGLSVCKQLVELMGGRIWVESAVGQGSVFAFSIPLKDCAKDSPALAAVGKTTPSHVVHAALGRHLRVLVVDDDSTNQRVASLVLQKLGCDTHCVSSGAACLENLENHSYDVILMDMEMPEMGGCEATYHIRARPGSERSRPWIIALTANVGKETSSQCAEAGMDDYLTKPLRVEPLRVALERYEHSLL